MARRQYWLAPRVWLRDGRVTGLGDRGHDRLREGCREICETHAIVRVRDAAGAREALQSAGRGLAAR
jgi:hypothetical protein